MEVDALHPVKVGGVTTDATVWRFTDGAEGARAI